jgi:hypothetical protein
VLAEIGVEAQRLVVLSLDQPLALKEINRKDCCMAAVAAAESQGAVLEIGKPGNRSTRYCDDPGRPTHIGIAHRDGSAALVAPGICLEISEVRIPGDVDAWQRLAR